MVLGIFIGGIFLGFSVGFATMALMAARDLRLQTEEVQAIGDCPVCASSPVRTFSPVRRARPQGSGILLTPWP